MLITLQLSFEDRDNNVSQHQVNFDISATGTSIAETVALLSMYKDACQGISDAVVSGAKIRLPKLQVLGGISGPSSDAYRRLTLFSLTNSGQATSISIPSPKLELFDVTGDFTGFRLLEQIATIQSQLQPFLVDGLMVDEALRPILGPFVVGCRSVQE